MKSVVKSVVVLLTLFLLGLGVAEAHFGMIIPSDDIVSQGEARVVTLRVMFAHPFEGNWMEMQRPRKFGVLIRGTKREELLQGLKPIKVKGHTAWQMAYRLKRPGDYVFYVEPEPYWEPAEGKFILHFTKVVVNAFGLEEGWDSKVGLPAEIVPLTRPYGLWTGNVFRGLVLMNGKPAPFCEVEVEYFNEGGEVHAPAEPFITQVIKTDSQGVFTYAMPRAGWWGFAALGEAPYKLRHEGKEYPVEMGAVIWVHVEDMR